jgi:uncharacterized protein (TIGR04141 family)
MKSAKPFSIFLLKDGFSAASSLEDGHSLQSVNVPDGLPTDSALFLLDTPPKFPWWREYFGITQNIKQESKGALLFLPVGGRVFAVSFGMVFHHLNNYAYEYDFGLIVTLNSLDPSLLKSADMMEPGAARRKRTQVPVSSDLTYLDFDGDSQVIKTLTGKVKEEFKELFKNATGGASLKVSLKLEPSELPDLCATLLSLYAATDYKTTFPNIQNITPIKDPAKIDELNKELLHAFNSRSDDLNLGIPDVVDYRDNTCCIFKADGHDSDVLPDIALEELYEFLGELDLIGEASLEDLKSFKMILADADGHKGRSYSIFRCILYELSDPTKKLVYHFCEGNWFCIQADFIKRLEGFIDPRCEDTTLCPYDHDNIRDGKPTYSEENFNAALPIWDDSFICLDQTNISPTGSSQIEPCDLFRVVACTKSSSGCRAEYYHVKISTRSAQLSHLFNQGVNSIELIELHDEVKENMMKLVEKHIGVNDLETYHSPFGSRDFKVIFSIITHKDPAMKSGNLPLFSRISLMRVMQRCELMRIQTALQFVPDESPKKGGFNKYQTICAEICEQDGKKVVLPREAGYNPNTPVKRCPSQVSQSPLGTRFNISVRRGENGALNSYHAWPFQQL